MVLATAMFALIAVAIALYLYGTRTFGYWRARGVPHDRPLPFLGTNAQRFLLRRSIAQLAADVYRRYPKEPYVGFYRGTIPELVVRDPDLIKRILVTDFAHFHSRGVTSHHRTVEPLLRNLFFADGDLWRLLRQRTSPAFTSGKLRAMFPLVAERAERLQERALAAAPAGPLDARDLMARFTTDFIGACGFGLDADSLNDESSPFRKLGDDIFNVPLGRAIMNALKNIFPDAFQNWKFLGQELEDGIVGLVRNILEERGGKPSGRNDFIDFLMEWRARGKLAVESLERRRADGLPERLELELDDALLAAQAFIFFAAGFETSSSTMSFALHQLAYEPRVQALAQHDVDAALAAHDGRLCYEAIREMRYLELVVQEALRMSPPSAFLMRVCVRRYTVPGTRVTLEPGVKVCVPLAALQNDPQHYEQPAEFRPERFLPDEVAKRHKSVYLPFGDGPRACIGGRLGQMQSMAGLAAVLARLSVAPAPGARRDLRLDPMSTIVENVLGGIPLVFTPRPQPVDAAR